MQVVEELDVRGELKIGRWEVEVGTEDINKVVEALDAGVDEGKGTKRLRKSPCDSRD